jgi:hypothetical protein
MVVLGAVGEAEFLTPFSHRSHKLTEIAFSFDGLMMEIGAFRTNMNADIEWTTPGGAWNEYADVLYCECMST